jgi:hypothetical protein
VLLKICGPKNGELREDWGRLHNEERHYLYCSPNIFRVIKSRKIRCVGNVEGMGEMRGINEVLVWKPEENSSYMTYVWMGR